MASYGYIKIPLRWFPQNIIDQYKIMDFVDKYGYPISIYESVCRV